MQCHQETAIPDRSFVQQAYHSLKPAATSARKAQPWLEAPGAQVGYGTDTRERGPHPGYTPCTPTAAPLLHPHTEAAPERLPRCISQSQMYFVFTQ